MKPGIHPEYRDVVFVDMTSGVKFITRSTISTREKVKMEDGKEYPMFKLDITSESHPFYTGEQRLIDTEGQVDRFAKRLARRADEVTDKTSKQAKRRAKRQIAEIIDDEAVAPIVPAAAE